MRNFFLKMYVTLQVISLAFIGILTIVFYNCFNFSLYEDFYTSSNLANDLNISYQELINHTHNLLDYLNSKTSLDSSWFSNTDIAHMVDVKNLYIYNKETLIACTVIFILTSLVLAFTLKKNTLYFISSHFNSILLSIFSTVVILSMFAAFNFSDFWFTFHKLLFSNDLWLLDPAESNLIKMVPEEFFIKLVSRIVIEIIIYFSVLVLVNIFIVRKYKKKENITLN